MAIRNFTGDEKQKLYGELYCSKELSGGIHDHLICFAVVHSVLSLTTFLGNTLILVALYKESSLHPPSKILFRNLATTDLCVGIIAEPLWVAYLIFAMNEQSNICRYTSAIFHITSYTLCTVSLFTLTAISMDRLLALLLGLRYRQVVTLRRISLTLTLSWIVSTIASTAYFWNHQINSWFSYIVVSLCLVTSIFAYAKFSLVFVITKFMHMKILRQCQLNQPCAIQKNSVHCIMGAAGITCLLSAARFCGGFCPTKRYCIIGFRCKALFNNFDSPKLVIKPNSLLLEDQRSQTSGKRNNQRTFFST